MNNAIMFQKTYKCKIEQTKEMKLVSEKVTDKGSWVETETVHEPIYKLQLTESDFHRLLDDMNGVLFQREIKEKHSAVEKAYNEFLVLLNLYR
jgi:hypothetical protein